MREARHQKASDGGKKMIEAVIGVWHEGDRAYYVKRSQHMENYPGAWSLFSIQIDPGELPDALDLAAAQRLMERMSAERLGGSPIRVTKFLNYSTCSNNPIGRVVNLRLYAVDCLEPPRLNPLYYEDGAWMTWDEYGHRKGDVLCGSCMRMWRDYCLRISHLASRVIEPTSESGRSRP